MHKIVTVKFLVQCEQNQHTINFNMLSTKEKLGDKNTSQYPLPATSDIEITAHLLHIRALCAYNYDVIK